jgi:hypothetical protein
MNKTTTDAELAARIDALVVEADRLSAESTTKNFPNLSPDKHSAEYVSDKWCKIVTVQGTGSGRSVYGFVCLVDGETKALGKVKRGDIHKAASWKAPAKHARGSVFAADFGGRLGCYGPAYLR